MSDFIAVCFDISDSKRLRRVSNELENFGKRVQRSLFKCHLDDKEFKDLKERMADLIDEKQNHVRYYLLCPKDVSGIIIDGSGEKTMDSNYYMA